MFRRFARIPKVFRRIALSAIAILMLLAVVRFALPFTIIPGPLSVNYVANSPSISTAGMPMRDQFAKIAEEGFQVVVNLAPPSVAGSHKDEQALVEAQGMRYYGIPVDFDAPRREDFERFVAIMKQHRRERVLVHCQINLRASTFVFLYRVLELGEDPDRAYQDVAKIWQPHGPWLELTRKTLAASGKSLPLELERKS
jgi:protein tyrosine phosphatase (PTP) superfamily phosphohydrolase (DUF442 family)